MTTSLIKLKHCTVFDGTHDDLIEDAQIIIEGGCIKEVTSSDRSVPSDSIIDCQNRFVMPGMIDAHFHAYTPTFDMIRLDHMPPTLRGAYAGSILNGALHRGFTTVRDAAGGDIGLARALEKGLIEGPRFFYSGKAISQTGGHGDFRPTDFSDPCACSYSGQLSVVADGEDEVRKAAREQLRQGATQIKLFISGGVVSPSDPIWLSQFTDAEIIACVEEAERRRTYVMAHCHTAETIRRCSELGVRSIEHGSDIDDETAKILAANGTYVVPTLSVFEIIKKHGPDLGLPETSLEKLEWVYEKTLGSIETCRKHNVKLGLGTDLLGFDYHQYQAHELLLRSKVDATADILRSVTSINAEILNMEGRLGCIAPGAYADLLVLEKNPFDELGLFADIEDNIALLIRNGEIIKNQL